MKKIGWVITMLFLLQTGISSAVYGQFMDFELNLKSTSKLQAVEVNTNLESDYIYVPEDMIYFWVKLSNYKNFDLFFEVFYTDESESDHLPSLVKVYDQRKEIFETAFDAFFDIRPIAKYLYNEESFKDNPLRYETFFGFPIKHTSEVNLIYN